MFLSRRWESPQAAHLLALDPASRLLLLDLGPISVNVSSQHCLSCSPKKYDYLNLPFSQHIFVFSGLLSMRRLLRPSYSILFFMSSYGHIVHYDSMRGFWFPTATLSPSTISFPLPLAFANSGFPKPSAFLLSTSPATNTNMPAAHCPQPLYLLGKLPQAYVHS